MKNRALSILLALLLVVSLLPGFAAAKEEKEPEELIEVDVSDRLIQAGGMPVQAEPKRGESGNKTAALAAIAAGLSRRAERIDISEFELTPSECGTCYWGAVNSHPELFYVDTTFSYSPSGDYVLAVYPRYNAEYDENDTALFNSVCAAILAGMPANGTDEEKMLYIHDYIVTHCQYDLSLSRHNAYHCLVEGDAVCQGYALGFLYLCSLAELEAEYVSSAALNHGWNVVELNDAHYYVDCTWDDPITENDYGADAHNVAAYCMHTHFLVCKEDFSETHKSSDWVNAEGKNVYASYTTTEAYRYGWWKSFRENTMRPAQWVGDRMYYTRTDDDSHIYRCDPGLTNETEIEIQGAPAQWRVFDDSGRVWMSYFITVASLNGSIYYNTPTQIWKMTASGSFSQVYSLTSAELAKGYIYGVTAENGSLAYDIAVSPNSPSAASSVVSFTPLEVTGLSVDETAFEVGETITWSATATGGVKPLQYCFYIYQGGTKIHSTGYRSSNTVSFVPEEAGTYKAKVFVKDSAGSSASKMGPSVSVTEPVTPLTVGSLTVNKTAFEVGETITWSASATGGAEPLRYCFYIYKNGTRIHSTGYGLSKTVSFTPEGSGTYSAKVFVKDSTGSLVNMMGPGVTVTEPIVIEGVEVDKTSADVGETITWTVSAEGGNGTLRYCFYIYRNGTRIHSTGYGLSKTVSFTTEGSGTYSAKAFVKDSTGVSVNMMGPGVTVAAPLVINGVEADRTSADVGETITWTVSAEGGNGTLKYCFYIYKGGSIVYKSGYKASTSCSYNVGAAGSYSAKAFVKDSTGASTNMMGPGVTVTEPLVINGVEADRTSAEVGDTITWTVSAEGGNGTLKYCFYIYKGGSIVYKSGYKASTSCSYKVDAAGSYKAKAFVKDGSGTVVTFIGETIPVT